jgi:hypothetical protein
MLMLGKSRNLKQKERQKERAFVKSTTISQHHFAFQTALSEETNIPRRSYVGVFILSVTLSR